MKCSHTLLFFVYLWSSQTLANKDTAQVNQTVKRNTYEQQIDSLLHSLQSITKVPGYSVAVVHQGKTVASVSTDFSHASSKTKANEKSIFRLASVSKVIGATMLAELVVEGKLDPDTSIGHYLPKLDEKYHQITLRQLLSHTSGMPHYQMKDRDIYDDHYSSAMAALVTLKSRQLLSKPGEQYKYSTHGYTLAGAIYEQLTNKSLSASLPDFITRWTGRKTPLIENILDLPANASDLYAYSDGKIKKQVYGEKSYSVFGAGLSATAIDLAYFGAQVLNKSQVNNAYQKLLFEPSTLNDGNPVNTSQYSVGFGWRIGDDGQGRKVYHHAGATPGARSVLVLYPDQQLSIAILSNTSWVSGIDKMAYSIAGLYLDQAKLLPFNSDTQYKAVLSDSTVKGDVVCTNALCTLENESSSYTTWQNKFNFTGQFFDDWPIFHYSSTTGKRLLLISKTGITTLLADDGVYKAPLSKDKTYSVELLN